MKLRRGESARTPADPSDPAPPPTFAMRLHPCVIQRRGDCKWGSQRHYTVHLLISIWCPSVLDGLGRSRIHHHTLPPTPLNSLPHSPISPWCPFDLVLNHKQTTHTHTQSDIHINPQTNLISRCYVSCPKLSDQFQSSVFSHSSALLCYSSRAGQASAPSLQETLV